MKQFTNISLVGMPGAGKSTLGVLLAKETAGEFIDTDLLIQEREHCTLQEIIDRRGVRELRAIEEDVILALTPEQAVIATGGSAVYSRKAVAHLRTISRVVSLDVSLETVHQRIHNFSSRGLARQPGQGLDDLYAERAPLYTAAAHLRLCVDGLHHEQALAALLAVLKS